MNLYTDDTSYVSNYMKQGNPYQPTFKSLSNQIIFQRCCEL